jgi:hypothetical protein
MAITKRAFGQSGRDVTNRCSRGPSPDVICEGAASKRTDAANAVLAAARDLGVRLTGHDDLLRRVQAATQRIANSVETARAAGHLKSFNSEYRRVPLPRLLP